MGDERLAALAMFKTETADRGNSRSAEEAHAALQDERLAALAMFRTEREQDKTADGGNSRSAEESHEQKKHSLVLDGGSPAGIAGMSQQEVIEQEVTHKSSLEEVVPGGSLVPSAGG